MHRLLLKNNTHTRLDIIDCHEIIIPLWVIVLYGLRRVGRHGHWWNPLLLFHGKTNRLCSVDSEQIVKAILLCKRSVVRLPAFFAMYKLALALAIHPLHLIRNCSCSFLSYQMCSPSNDILSVLLPAWRHGIIHTGEGSVSWCSFKWMHSWIWWVTQTIRGPKGPLFTALQLVCGNLQRIT